MKISDLKQDIHNANRGTERGTAALKNSIHQYGTGRSVLADKKGRIIAGNKTVQQAQDAGVEEIEIVKSDGKKLIVVQRTDLDLEKDPKARELAYADNRTGQLNLEWDLQAILEDLQNGVNLDGLWNQEELDEILNRIPEVDFKEFDESIEKEVQYNECPKCGHQWPK